MKFKHSFWNQKIPIHLKYTYFGLILLGIVLLFVGSLVLGHIFFPMASSMRDSIVFHIEDGESSYAIASDLEEQGFIRSRTAFTVYALVTRRLFNLQNGDYFLSPSMSMEEILTKITQGDVIFEEITVKDGWSLKNIAEEFEERGYFTKEELYKMTGFPGIDYRVEPEKRGFKDFSKEFNFLRDKPDYISLEGYLFPDTYQITKNEQPENIVRRMLKNFEEKIGNNISFEKLTMASIIEKEVRSLKDKKLVSGVLWKRIENSVRLQVDATVVYIRPENYKIVSIDETKIESPYNTYRVDGLPLGPISNPSLKSVEAALEPEDSPYWFYLSPSLNTTIFSRTFEEHKAAKVKYLQ